MRTFRLGAISRARTGVVPALLLAVLPVTAALSSDGGPGTAQRVQVFPDHFVAGGKRFTSVDGLDQWVRSSGVKALQFHSCMWSANERLAAAIERLQHVYLEVRWTAAGKAGCPAVAGEKAGHRP